MKDEGKRKYKIESETYITRIDQVEESVLISRRDVQDDAPIVTVVAREAVAVAGDLTLLAIGAEHAAGEYQSGDPRHAWLLEVARRARAVDLIPFAGPGADSPTGSLEPLPVHAEDQPGRSCAFVVGGDEASL